jgi:hypothetical protein
MVNDVKGIKKDNVTSVKITFTDIDATLPIKISVLGCFRGMNDQKWVPWAIENEYRYYNWSK